MYRRNCSFSTEHETDLVEKWIIQKGSDKWEGEIDNWEDSYTEKTHLDSTDYREGDGYGNCDYDD